MLFKTCVKSRQTKKYEVIESDYPNKSAFISDLKGNGYMVNPDKVVRSEVYNYIMNYTNCEEWDWINYQIDKDGNIVETNKFNERHDKRMVKLDKRIAGYKNQDAE